MTKKKLLIIAVSLLLVVALGILIWFALGLENPTTTPENSEEEGRTEVYSDNLSLFESVTVKNSHGEYTLIKKNNLCYLLGNENVNLLPASSKDVFEFLSSVYSTKTVSEEGTEGFGFENPSAKITVNKYDGTHKTLLIGDIAPNTEGCRYFCFEGENTVYLLDKDRSERYTAKKETLYSKTISKYFTNDKMLSISIKTPENEVLLRPAKGEEETNLQYISGFIMEKPFLFGADSEIITSLCEKLSSLPSAEIAEDSVDESKLLAYGIDGKTVVTVVANYDTASMTTPTGEINPYYDSTNKEGYVTLTTTYKIGITSENRIYFTYDDMPIIYSLEKSDFDFLGYDTYQYCQRLVNIAYLTDLSGLQIEADGKSYNIDIKSEDEDVTSVLVDYDPKDISLFKSFYQNLVSISHNGLENKPDTKEVLLKITYEFKDGTTQTVEFLPLSDSRKAFMSIDGEGRFSVLLTKVEKIKNDLSKFLEGKEIMN